MGIVKFKRPLLVEGTEVPPEGGFDGGAVDSVNGKTGDVTITAEDIGGDVNPVEGTVAVRTTDGRIKAGRALDLDDVTTIEDMNEVYGLVLDYTQQTFIQTVNGKSGDEGNVTLTAADVGALPDTYTPAWGDVTGKPAFAAVATSGAYSDLSGTPTLDFATISAIEGDWRGEGVETLGAALLALQGA